MLNKYRIEYLFFLFFGKLLSLFGVKSIKYSSKVLTFVFYHIVGIRKKIVFKNLTLAFPELTKKEIKKLAYNNYKSLAISFLEIFNFPSLSKNDVKSLLSAKGFDLVNEKLKEEKGLILLTGHFGNWELGALASGIHIGKKINVLVKKQHNPYVYKWLKKMRERFGNKEVELGASVRELFKAIKNKEIIGVVGDQRGPKEGIKVSFFNIETPTYIGTAAIALKTKCPVLVLLCARLENGTYEYITKEIEYQKFRGSKEDITKQFNQEYMKILEEAIRKHPEQWFWMHNIWKHA